MGTLFSYAIGSSIILAALYFPYRLLLAPLKQPRLNRFTILLIYVISLTAIPIAKWWIDFSASTAATQATPEISLDGIYAFGVTEGPRQTDISDILLICYLAGVLLATIITVASILRLIFKIKQSPVMTIRNSRVHIPADSHFSPFSIFGMISVPAQDLPDADIIVAHEQMHIRFRHSFDLVFAQAVALLQWFNPASWLMIRELKAVHEYQVDDSLIASGINIRQYQYLLIKKAVGSRFPSITNSLNHSNLKSRITMMLKKSNHGANRWRGVVLVPALAAALAVVNLPAVASVLNEASNSRLPELSTHKVNTFSAIEQEVPQAVDNVVAQAEPTVNSKPSAAVIAGDNGQRPVVAIREHTQADDVVDQPDVLPQFPGGEVEMMTFIARNMVYPESAIRDNIQGRVVVRFIIDTEGNVTSPTIIKSISPVLDEEAIRVVSMLPRFNPAQHNGKNVSAAYVLPVSFRLSGDNNTQPKSNTGRSDIPGAVFVNNEPAPASILKDIKPADIEKIEIIKDDPDYPDGKIMITLK